MWSVTRFCSEAQNCNILVFSGVFKVCSEAISRSEMCHEIMINQCDQPGGEFPRSSVPPASSLPISLLFPPYIPPPPALPSPGSPHSFKHEQRGPCIIRTMNTRWLEMQIETQEPPILGDYFLELYDTDSLERVSL